MTAFQNSGPPPTLTENPVQGDPKKPLSEIMPESGHPPNFDHGHPEPMKYFTALGSAWQADSSLMRQHLKKIFLPFAYEF